MPEHETFDLDAAFARLEQDITTLSSAPGAGAAVARARRRRRTTISAVAALTVLAVGGAAIAEGVVRHDSATITPSSTLPAPGPLTADALSAATDGWTSAWTSATPNTTHFRPGPADRCSAAAPQAGDVRQPTRGSGNLFFNAGAASSFATLLDYQDQEGATPRLWTWLTTTFDRCAGSTPIGHRSWDGGEARSYRLVSASGKTQHVWITRATSSIGLFEVDGARAAVPAATDDAVMQTMLAALLAPESYHDVSATGSSTSSSSSATVGISEVSFGDALEGWQSGWSATSGSTPDTDSAPCGTDLSGGATLGSSQSLGANGEQGTIGFGGPAGARAALQSIGDGLTACTSTTYDVHTVPWQGGSVTVAAGTGSGADVVWLVRDGRQIAYATIPAGDTTPPDSVTAKVAGLLRSLLDESPAHQQ